MAKTNKTDDFDINIFDLFQTIWKGKWKILLGMVVSIVSVLSYEAMQIKNFTATTDLVPISLSKQNEYIVFNDQVKHHKTFITKEALFNSYIEVLREKSLFEDAIHKYSLVDVGNFVDEQAYDEAVIKLASTVIINSELIHSQQSKNSNLRIRDMENRDKIFENYTTIKFSYHDEKKWKDALTYVDELANKIVKENYYNQVEKKMEINFKNKQASIEDITLTIDNSITDYDRLTSDRLAYLNEQSEIAKALGISKNSIEVVEKYDSQNALTIYKVAKPYYLRGYEAIDKEIGLIYT